MERPGLSTLTPFADFQPDQFLDIARKGGFTPAGAMKLYDEIRKFGHNSVRREPVNEADALWDQVRARYSDRLRQVRTPKDFQDYLKAGSSLVTGHENIDKDPKQSVIKQSLINQWMAVGNHQRIDRSEAINRFSGQFAYQQPEQWKAWDDMGMEWEDLEAAIGHDIMSQPEHAQVKGSAIQALQEAVKASGLCAIEWQAASGVGSFAGNLAGNITQANTDLQKRTGWEGGVLGLKGHVSLNIGMENTGGDGWCCPQAGTDRCWIKTSSQAGWGVVAHEWMHGLDFAMGFDHKRKKEGLASSSKSKTSPWHRLISGLRTSRSAPELGEVIGAELIDGFKRRWAAAQFPDDLPELLERLRLERDGRTNLPKKVRDSHLKQIKQCLAQNGTHAELTTLRAEIAMAEMDLLADHQATIQNGGSIWIQFADRFKDNIIKHQPGLAKDYADYFKSAVEQVAHSFEATFGPEGAFITDVAPESAPLRYPLAAEAIGHKLAWQRMFKEIGPWWNSLGAPSDAPEEIGMPSGGKEREPEMSMAARLSMRSRTAQEDGARKPVSPATP